MKNKLYRVLVMLLAIAMMIPSFAMAEPAPATPTLTLSGKTAIEREYNPDSRQMDTSETKFTVAGIPEGTSNGYIEWTIDKDKYFSFQEYSRVASRKVFTGNTSDSDIPSVFLTRNGFNEVLADASKKDVSATLSGQLFVDYKAVGSPVTVTFKVTKVDVLGIKWVEEPKLPAEIDLGQGQHSLYLGQYVSIQNPEEGIPSYGDTDVYYKVIEGGEYAYVNKGGNIYFQKATPEGKKVKVVAYIPGSANASLEKSAAVHEFTVIGPSDGQGGETPQEPDTYQFVAFTTGAEGRVYTTSSPYITLWQGDSDWSDGSLIKTIPDSNNVGAEFNDELVWTIDQPGYAHLGVDPNYVGLSFYTDLGVDEFPPVKVTVASKRNPSVTDYCYVQYVPNEEEQTEDKGYTTLAFQPFKEITVAEDDNVNLMEYLVAEKADNSKDKLIWQNDKKLDIEAGEGYAYLWNTKAKDSPITVTVKSKLNGKSDTFKINVVKRPNTEGSYSKVEFAVKSVETARTTYDILPLLTLEGNGDPSQLIFTSSDPTIATVYPVTSGMELQRINVEFQGTPKDGDKVTIEVRNGASSATSEPSTLEVIYVENADEQETYKIGFTKSSLDVALSQESIDLKAYVYVQDKDGKKISNDKAREVIGSLIWTSENPAIATVSNGSAELKKAGTATISIRTGYSSEKLESITLNIKDEDETDLIKGIKFSTDKEIVLERGLPLDAFKYLVFTDMDGREITDPESAYAIRSLLIWTSDDKTVANVSTEGVVTAAKEGSATINVRYNAGQEKQTASLKIKVVKPESETFTKVKFAEPKTMDAHIDKQTKTFVASEYLALEGNGDKGDLVWTSDDETIAKVEDGQVNFTNRAKDGDTVKITVRYDEGKETLTDTLTLKVVWDKKPYTSLKFAQEKINLVGEADLNTYLLAEGNDFDEDDLIWTSENQQIATVNKNGVVSVKPDAKDGDTVKITVRSKLDSTKTATITLTVKQTARKITKITLTQDTFELEPKGELYLGRYVVTEPVEHDDALWFTSDDPSVAIQNNYAYVDANLLDDGEAHITVRSVLNPDVSAKFTLKLKGKGATSIAFKDAPKTFYKEMNRLDLRDYLVTNPADYAFYHRDNLIWESSDPTVALAYHEEEGGDGVLENVYGILTYVQPGNVTIKVTDKVSGKSAKVKLTLKEKHPVESIKLKNINMEVNDVYDLTKGFITFTPANADFDPSNITWTSSNRDVAEVQVGENAKRWSTGSIVKAYKAGKTKITANYEREDGTFVTAKCTVTVKEVKLADVKFAESKYNLKLNSNLQAYVRFNIEPFNCSYKKNEIYFVSNNTDIVSVTDYAVDKDDAHKGSVTITAKAPGTAWVVAKLAKNDKVLDACKVVVKAVKLKTVKWEKKSVKLYWYNDGISQIPEGPQANTVHFNTIRVKPIINPENAYCNVTFETTDPGVAFVDDDSVKGFQNAIESGSSLSDVEIKAVGPGTCKIIMKVNDGKKIRKASLKVEVETKRVDLQISQKKATLKLQKGSDILYLRAYDADTDKDVKVKWASSNTKVAKVNTEGKVRAVGAGTATISATTKNGQKIVVKCKVTVKAAATKNEVAKKITGDTKVTVKVGEKKALDIKVKPEGAKVTFTSSDSEIVKVTKDGKIKGIKAGKATITVKAVNGKAELKIKVIVK